MSKRAKEPPYEPAEISVAPAAPERWGDLETLFAGIPCWCQAWRLPAGDYGRSSKDELGAAIARRKQEMRRQLERPTPPGVIAYGGGEAVGWCGFGPRPEMERLVRSRTIPAVDNRPIWAIVCFIVRAGHRRRGVARALLRGAIACAQRHGAPALEAYPVDPDGKRISAPFAYVGTVAMFEREGFQRVVETASRSAGLPRWLVRLEL